MMNIFLSSIYSLLKEELHISEGLDLFFMGALSFLLKVFFALAAFFIGKKIIKWILRLFGQFLARAQAEKGVVSFLVSLARILLFVVLFGFIADILGIKTTSFVAVLGTIGLALGLSLQGSLSNFAGGVLILILKPYKVGDYIVALGNEGTVVAIDIFYTQMLTPDNRRIVMPNGSLSNSSIINVTHESARRLDLEVPVTYEADIAMVKEVLSGLYIKNEMTMKNREPEIFISRLEAQAVIIKFSMWTEKENYGKLKGELLERIKIVFKETGIGIWNNK